MTNQEILTKVMQKAIDGGWWEDEDTGEKLSGWTVHPNCKFHDNPVLCLESFAGSHYEPQSFIFNHDFAKALWGEGAQESTVEHRKGAINTPRGRVEYDRSIVRAPLFPMTNWQYHLQQMVIADNPIKYLGEHLPE